MKQEYALTELKDDLRDQIRDMRDCVRRLKKTESEGVDKMSGHYAKTGKFDMLRDMQAQIDILESFIKMLNRVTTLRRKRGAR